jgi:hypothetical protein
VGRNENEAPPEFAQAHRREIRPARPFLYFLTPPNNAEIPARKGSRGTLAMRRFLVVVGNNGDTEVTTS